ncbi:MAG: hypothetical protein RIM72_12965 [Alphaproteobacteria bacterium]
MRKTIINLIFAAVPIILMPGVSSAADPACRVKAQPLLDLSFQFPPVVYERNKSRVQLSMESSGSDRIPTSNEIHTAGLTTYRETQRVEVGGFVGKLQNGTFCFMTNKAKVVVGYDRVTVAVDRNYPPGSCEYGAVFDHEERHVAIIKQAYLNELPALRSTLQAGIVGRGAAIGRTAKEAQSRAAAQIGALLRPHMQAVSQKRRAANAELDTPESYRRTRELCSNW